MELRIRKTPGQFQRHMIVSLDGTYWTGTRWSFDRAEAGLFLSYEDAERELGRLLGRMEGVSVQRFEARISVIVESDAEIDTDSLGLLLHMSADLLFTPTLPPGYHVELVWGSLRRVDDE